MYACSRVHAHACVRVRVCMYVCEYARTLRACVCAYVCARACMCMCARECVMLKTTQRASSDHQVTGFSLLDGGVGMISTRTEQARTPRCLSMEGTNPPHDVTLGVGAAAGTWAAGQTRQTRWEGPAHAPSEPVQDRGAGAGAGRPGVGPRSSARLYKAHTSPGCSPCAGLTLKAPGTQLKQGNETMSKEA